MFVEGIFWAVSNSTANQYGEFTIFGYQLVATLIGVGGGVFGGLAVDRWRRKKDIIKTRNQFIDSVAEELKNAQEGVKKFRKNPAKWEKMNNEMVGEKPLILKPAYDALVHSGNFGLLNTNLQTGLASAYLSIDAINFYSDLIRRFDFNTNFIRGVDFTANEICDKLGDNVEKLAAKLESLIPELENAKQQK